MSLHAADEERVTGGSLRPSFKSAAWVTGGGDRRVPGGNSTQTRFRRRPLQPGGRALEEQGRLKEPIAECQKAIRLKPDSPQSHNTLDIALANEGSLNDAVAEFREAIRLESGDARAHNNLGNALRSQRRLDEAIGEYHSALRCNPASAETRHCLGAALVDRGQLAAAIGEYRIAVRLDPNHAESRNGLAGAPYAQGKPDEAIAELRKARDLARTDPQLAERIQRELADTERQASLAARLSDVLAGRLMTRDAAESISFAQLCYNKKLHGASARLWTEALQADPKLADDMQAQNRYNAACATALAGSGQGKDDPPLDEPAKARCRKQAIDWLKADLAAWSKVLEKGPPAVRQGIAQTLQHWKADADLAGIRDATALAKLPVGERKACRALWTEVDALLKKAGDNKR